MVKMLEKVHQNKTQYYLYQLPGLLPPDFYSPAHCETPKGVKTYNDDSYKITFALGPGVPMPYLGK